MKQNSQVFISVLIVLTIVLALGAGMLFYSRSFRDVTKFQVETDKAFALATSGIGIGESLARANACSPGGVNIDNTYNFVGGTIRIQIASTFLDNMLSGTITSSGRSAGGKSVRIVRKDFNLPARPPGFVQLRDSVGAIKGYYNTIQAAITAAASGDEVRCMGNNSGIFDGVFKENVTISKSLTLRGSYNTCFITQNIADTPTTIDGQQLNRVITCSAASAINVTIDHFIIQNGKINSAPGGGIYYGGVTGGSFTISNNIISGNTAEGSTGSCSGGGIYAVTYGTSIITNNVITNNTADSCGGGIHAWALSGCGSFTISNNTITGNTDKGYNSSASAGGIYASVSSPSSPAVSFIIIDNTITGNTGDDCGGISIWSASYSSFTIANNTINNNKITGTSANSAGGIYISTQAGAASTTVANNTITGNTAGYVGGIYAWAKDSGTFVTMTNNIITNNSGTYSGGIYANSSSGAITIRNNTITGNTVSNVGNGGGICAFSSSGGSITISNNTITGITSIPGRGGGIYAQSTSSNSNITITNNKITVNVSLGLGGGIYAFSTSSGAITISNNTITGNTASSGGSGGGIYANSSSGAITISNNTITGNTATGPSGGGIQCSGSVGSITIINTICYGNNPSNQVNPTTLTTVSYSDIEGGYIGGGNNINKTPVYVDASGGDYHLQDITANDNIIDGGDLNSPYSPEAQPPGLRTNRNDMGAYGGPGATVTIGFVMPTIDDPTTPDIRETVIGIY